MKKNRAASFKESISVFENGFRNEIFRYFYARTFTTLFVEKGHFAAFATWKKILEFSAVKMEASRFEMKPK